MQLASPRYLLLSCTNHLKYELLPAFTATVHTMQKFTIAEWMHKMLHCVLQQLSLPTSGFLGI